MGTSRKTTNAKMNRKPKTEKVGNASKARTPDDKGFQDRLTGMLAWLADKDPVRAARLVGDYLDDLAEELGAKAPKAAKS